MGRGAVGMCCWQWSYVMERKAFDTLEWEVGLKSFAPKALPSMQAACTLAPKAVPKAWAGVLLVCAAGSGTIYWRKQERG
jgi:hypothetical protein